jgi:hypothetical protein
VRAGGLAMGLCRGLQEGITDRRICDIINEPTMKALAIYSLLAVIAFVIYSAYYAIVGDNSPFWTIILVICLPVIAFASIYLVKKR